MSGSDYQDAVLEVAERLGYLSESLRTQVAANASRQNLNDPKTLVGLVLFAAKLTRDQGEPLIKAIDILVTRCKCGAWWTPLLCEPGETFVCRCSARIPVESRPDLNPYRLVRVGLSGPGSSPLATAPTRAPSASQPGPGAFGETPTILATSVAKTGHLPSGPMPSGGKPQRALSGHQAAAGEAGEPKAAMASQHSALGPDREPTPSGARSGSLALALSLFVAGGVAGVFGGPPVRSLFASQKPVDQGGPDSYSKDPALTSSPQGVSTEVGSPARVVEVAPSMPAVEPAKEPAPPAIVPPPDFESWIGRCVTTGPDRYLELLAQFPDPGDNAFAKDVGSAVRAMRGDLPKLDFGTACQALQSLEVRVTEARSVPHRLSFCLLQVPLEAYLLATWKNALVEVPAGVGQPGQAFFGMAERVDELFRRLFHSARAEVGGSAFERLGRELARMLDACTFGVNVESKNTRIQVAGVTNLQWFFGVCGGRVDHPAFKLLPIAAESGKSWLMPFRIPRTRLPTADAGSAKEMTEWLGAYGALRRGQLPERASMRSFSVQLQWPATHLVGADSGHPLPVWLAADTVQRYWGVQYVFDELCQVPKSGGLAWVVNGEGKSGSWSGFLRLAIEGDSK